jgi:nucleotide-binding universal stress UspA family protein
VDKLSTILAVVPQGGADGVLVDKVCRLVRDSGARVELFLAAPSDYFAIAARYAASHCNAPMSFTLYDAAIPLADAVLARAAEIDADLVVAPRMQLHLDHCPIPLLLVGKGAWAKEPRLAAAIDVAEQDSESLARGILHVAGFLTHRLTAHLDILYSEREDDDQPLRLERAVKLARLVREHHVGGERLQVFDGPPERTLPPLIAARHYDVLVLGNVLRHRALLSQLHSIAKRLTGTTDGDVLLVNPTPDGMAMRVPVSTRQQLAYQA